MRFALVLLLLPALPDERAERQFDRMKIVAPVLDEDVERRVVVYLLQKEHWIGAFTELSDRFGHFPEELDLTIDFNLEGEEVGRTIGRRTTWVISFNLKKLTELRKKLDEIEQWKRDGKQIVVKVPPLKMDRLIYHELTHVLQAGFAAPGWFVEGMAEMVADDPHSLYTMVKEKRAVRGLDAEITDRMEAYARGHLFWKWLETRGATPKTYELAFVRRFPWKQALEEATNRSWVNIVADEKEWSERELAKYK